jgi:hypothetical protein
MIYWMHDTYRYGSRPKTYLVPEKDRTKPPPSGAFRWLIPVFSTSNAELIQKCGLDAYFFLRYLRMLLKIFVPSAILILLILVPINSSANNPDVSGLDKLGWTNYDRGRTDRFWAHLLLAVGFLLWIAHVVYGELRGYIRVRQAYLTSPQHRLRASATTVLIRSVPRKWLTVEALDGLFDVFPGGVRNIWINRNFQELSDKVKLRDSLALKLESAETALIRNAKTAQMKMAKQKAKQEGKQRKKESRRERKKRVAQEDAVAFDAADQAGISSGDPHQAHTIHETLGTQSREGSPAVQQHDRSFPIPVLGQGIDKVRGGLGLMTGFGKKVFDDVRNVPKRLDHNIDEVYEGAGFSFDGQREPLVDPDEATRGRRLSSEPATAATVSTSGNAPWQSPQSTTTGRPSAEQTLPTSVAQRDYALGNTTTPSAFTSPQQVPTSVGSARTAVNEPQLNVQAPTAASRKPPPNKLEWNNKGFLEPEKKGWRYWTGSHDIALPSPEPYAGNEKELGENMRQVPSLHGSIGTEPTLIQKIGGFFTRKKPTPHDDGASVRESYPTAFNEAYDDDNGMENPPEWTKYLKPSDRSTMRLPLFGWGFMPFMPSWTLLGQKVDTIYYCRREVARLNVEIETDQREPEKFPLMNSAFIQFNNQVAAHMACQSVAHHFPVTMAPRLVEIAPGDVLWDNMSIGYKARFVRSTVVIVVIIGLIILWAIPVSFASGFSNLRNIQETWPAFSFIRDIPDIGISILQGIIPPLLVIILLALLPIILRFLAGFQGVPTGMSIELNVQGFYFAFLFVQLFLVITIASSIFNVFEDISGNPGEVAYILARNIPRAANYFFSYLILQALSVSAGALAQVAQLAIWFLLRPIVDNTARQKFNRQLNLQTVNWGTFFPVYTNLACIGLIYSVISPLVMVFNIITFSLFWVTYRYQTLYVNNFRFDTGGLLFPKAVNQLFTGIYVMEIALIGLFLLVQDNDGATGIVCLPQAIIMGVMLAFTVIFHVMININFSPLYRYMPITLEDDAVVRDEQFAKMQEARWAEREGLITGAGDENSGDEKGKSAAGSSKSEDIEDQLEHAEEREENEEKGLESIEMQDIHNRRSHHNTGTFHTAVSRVGTQASRLGGWADRSRRASKRFSHAPHNDSGSPNPTAVADIEQRHKHTHQHQDKRHSALPAFFSADTATAESGGAPARPKAPTANDHAAAVGDALFGSFSDEIEDLTAEERDTLVQRAFQHSALRSRRPVIWLPRDDLGVSDDEILRMRAFSAEGLWVSNEGTGLDRKSRVLFRRAPPDFSEVDLIEL